MAPVRLGRVHGGSAAGSQWCGVVRCGVTPPATSALAKGQRHQLVLALMTTERESE
jgi:hypothetical protein